MEFRRTWRCVLKAEGDISLLRYPPIHTRTREGRSGNINDRCAAVNQENRTRHKGGIITRQVSTNTGDLIPALRPCAGAR